MDSQHLNHACVNLAHPCETRVKGGCSHICAKNGDKVICVCPEDMQLDVDRKTCIRSKSFQNSTSNVTNLKTGCNIMHMISVHPCDMAGKGGCSHICKKNDGEEEEDGLGYSCGCPPGFKLQPDRKMCKKGQYNHHFITSVQLVLATAFNDPFCF